MKGFFQTVFAGSNEILVADTKKLESLTKSRGIHPNYYECSNTCLDVFEFSRIKKAKATNCLFDFGLICLDPESTIVS